MMHLVNYQPWSLMNRLHRDVHQALSDALGGSESDIADGAAWSPSTDVREENDKFVLRADLPGVAANDIEVSAQDGLLIVRGVRPATADGANTGFERIERVSGAFLRRFTLPESAQADAIKANYVNGVLEIVIPKVARVEAKRIDVTVN